MRKFAKSLAEALELKFSDDDPVWATNRVVGISGGWRVGKTTRGSFRTILGSLAPNARLIWLIGPDYVQAQEEFRMILEWCTKLDLIAKDDAGRPRISIPKDGSRELVTVTGCTIITKSAQHYERLGSVAPDGIVLCEPGQMSSEVYDMCLGRLAEKRGWLYMGGTLEDAEGKPRWQWFEDFILGALNNSATDHERSFILPTWSNTVIFPGGEHDPELEAIRAKVGEYQFQRRYGGRPTGVEHPCFSSLWDPGAEQDYLVIPHEELVFRGGAIGVDYGRTFEHPSAVVAISEDQYGRYWVRELWLGVRADPREIASIVESFKLTYDIWQGCVDPNQGFMGDALGFAVAKGGASGGSPTEMRISLVNGLLESNNLYFDATGLLVREVWASMRLCRRIPNRRKQLVYERPLGDDAAQALMYAVECLRGMPNVPLEINPGFVKFSWGNGDNDMEGRL